MGIQMCSMNPFLRRLTPLLLLIASPLQAQDAERATHADEASRPQLVFTHNDPSFQVRQYQLGCLSLLSYLVVSGGEALVIDPQRDVDHYLEQAKQLGAQVRYVALTHPHADFVAGHTELAARVGATILLSQHAGAAFAHQALADGDQITLGQVAITMWHTPGHTPNASTFLLGVAGEPQPRMAFTGDTLFIGGIGRPDLLDVPPAMLAEQSYASIQRLKALPDATLVLPAHGAGSLCGAHLSPATTSTIGAEKRDNEYLRIVGRSSFIARVLSHQPVAPQYFRFNVEWNLKGPPLVSPQVDLPPRLAGKQAGADGVWLVDLRDQRAYAEAHVRGAVNVALRGRLDTWTGIVVPFTAPVVLVGDEGQVREGALRLRRIGFDKLAGWLPDDAASWRADGLEVVSSRLVAPSELFAAMQKGEEPILIDVRTEEEHLDLRIGEMGNVPVTEHERLARTFPKDMPMLFLCNSAYRSSMAVGLAERAGFRNLASLDGGLDAWLGQGLPVRGRSVDANNLLLPEPIVPTQLQPLQPAAVVLDLRQEWEWRDWSIPGSKHVALEALPEAVAELPPDQVVILACKDGTQAAAAAGAILKQDPTRRVRPLRGGVTAYYRDIVLGRAAVDSRAMPSPTLPAPAAAAGATKPTAKKRNAGC